MKEPLTDSRERPLFTCNGCGQTTLLEADKRLPRHYVASESALPSFCTSSGTFDYAPAVKR